VLFGFDDPGTEFDDVVVAKANELWFRADVTPSANGAEASTECVGYYRASNGAVMRAVGPDWRACPATGAPATELVGAPPAELRVTTRPLFTYSLTTNPTAAVGVTVDPSACVTTDGVAGTFGPGDPQLDRITAVHIDLGAYLATERAVGDDGVSSTISLRMRQNRDYRFALGCTGG
jgi:hypothetical protein